MALTSNQPIERDGKIYDKLAANLALSPVWKDDGIAISIAVRLTPYCITDDTLDYIEDESKGVVFGDATQSAHDDPDVAAFLESIEAAGQTFINAKGL